MGAVAVSKKLIVLIILILFIVVGSITYKTINDDKYKAYQNNNSVSSKKTIEAVTKEINLENSKNFNVAK